MGCSCGKESKVQNTTVKKKQNLEDKQQQSEQDSVVTDNHTKPRVNTNRSKSINKINLVQPGNIDGVLNKDDFINDQDENIFVSKDDHMKKVSRIVPVKQKSQSFSEKGNKQDKNQKNINLQDVEHPVQGGFFQSNNINKIAPLPPIAHKHTKKSKRYANNDASQNDESNDLVEENQKNVDSNFKLENEKQEEDVEDNEEYQRKIALKKKQINSDNKNDNNQDENVEQQQHTLHTQENGIFSPQTIKKSNTKASTIQKTIEQHSIIKNYNHEARQSQLRDSIIRNEQITYQVLNKSTSQNNQMFRSNCCNSLIQNEIPVQVQFQPKIQEDELSCNLDEKSENGEFFQQVKIEKVNNNNEVFQNNDSVHEQGLQKKKSNNYYSLGIQNNQSQIDGQSQRDVDDSFEVFSKKSFQANEMQNYNQIQTKQSSFSKKQSEELKNQFFQYSNSNDNNEIKFINQQNGETKELNENEIQQQQQQQQQNFNYQYVSNHNPDDVLFIRESKDGEQIAQVQFQNINFSQYQEDKNAKKIDEKEELEQQQQLNQELTETIQQQQQQEAVVSKNDEYMSSQIPNEHLDNNQEQSFQKHSRKLNLIKNEMNKEIQDTFRSDNESEIDEKQQQQIQQEIGELNTNNNNIQYKDQQEVEQQNVDKNQEQDENKEQQQADEQKVIGSLQNIQTQKGEKDIDVKQEQQSNIEKKQQEYNQYDTQQETCDNVNTVQQI